MPQDFTGGVKHGFTKEGLVRVPLLFPPKLNTLEYRRVELSGQECGEAGTWKTDISGLEKNWFNRCCLLALLPQLNSVQDG